MPNRINYQLEMEKVLRTLDGHAAKAPAARLLCSPVQRDTGTPGRAFRHHDLILQPQHLPTGGIPPPGGELERFVEEAGYHYPVVELPYDPQEFYTAVKGLESEPEKGARCTVCYRLRLEQAAPLCRRARL